MWHGATKDIYLLFQIDLYFPPHNLYFCRAVSGLSYPSWVEDLLNTL